MTNKTPEEWEIELGRRIRELRLRKNITQQDLADKAVVSLNVVKRLEGGSGTTVGLMIRILVALERTDWIELLEPKAPLLYWEKAEFNKSRKRASNRKKQ
ncbi:MAG: helix-turn-helix domain-containing protein [bacterium]